MALAAVLLLILVAFAADLQAAPLAAPGERTALLLLLDSSGSMRQNDGSGLRRGAAATTVTLLRPEDHVAVVEFDSTARQLTPGDGWVNAGDGEALGEALDRVGSDGEFTDLRAALDLAARLFAQAPPADRRILLLLSDGLLEPNPLDPTYAPHHLEYRLRAAAAGRSGRRALVEELRARLAPIALSRIREKVLPRLRTSDVEIFAIGLGDRVDMDLLRDLADATSRSPLETHASHARRAVDLLEHFARIAEHWTDQVVLRQDAGPLGAGDGPPVFVDELLDDVRLVALLDARGAGVFGASGSAAPIDLRHPSFHGFRLTSGESWRLRLPAAQGEYRALWVGRSLLRLAVDGLRAEYDYGEPVEATVRLKLGGRAPEQYLSPGAEICGRLELEASRQSTALLFVLEQDQGNAHRLRLEPTSPGRYELQMVAHARDRQGRELLPRPALTYRFEVRPRLFARPDELHFGSVERGARAEREIEIHFGLGEAQELQLASAISESSRDPEALRETSRLPVLAAPPLRASPGSVVTTTVALEVPADGLWGHHQGEITILTVSGERASIPFTVHVPSLFERLTWPLVGLLLLLAATLAYLSWLWAALGMPAGVLVALAAPERSIAFDIRLGEIRRGFCTRYLHYRRNRIAIGRQRAHVALRHLPVDVCAELSFTPSGRAYVRNESVRSANAEIVVREEPSRVYRLRPGSAFELRHRSILELGGYRFRYDRPIAGRRGELR